MKDRSNEVNALTTELREMDLLVGRWTNGFQMVAEWVDTIFEVFCSQTKVLVLEDNMCLWNHRV